MKSVFILCVLPAITSQSAWAIDAWQKIAQERPKNIDVSTTVASSGRFFSATYSDAYACPPLNTIHSWILTLATRDGEPLTGAAINLSADMPEHLHGMTTNPQVSEEVCGLSISSAGLEQITRPKVVGSPSNGQYLIQGMNFHMPGWWVVTLDVSRGGGRDLARFNLLVGEGYCHD